MFPIKCSLCVAIMKIKMATIINQLTWVCYCLFSITCTTPDSLWPKTHKQTNHRSSRPLHFLPKAFLIYLHYYTWMHLSRSNILQNPDIQLEIEVTCSLILNQQAYFQSCQCTLCPWYVPTLKQTAFTRILRPEFGTNYNARQQICSILHNFIIFFQNQSRNLSQRH